MHIIFLVAKKLSNQGPVISLYSRKLGRRSSTNEKEQLSCIQNAYWLANSYNFTLKIHALLSHGEKAEQGVRSMYVLFIRKKKVWVSFDIWTWSYWDISCVRDSVQLLELWFPLPHACFWRKLISSASRITVVKDWWHP